MRGGALLLALILAKGAWAGEPVRLARATSVSAFPRIAAPRTPATAKINAALTRLDRRWSDFARECRSGGKDNEASRRVRATLTGPRFLSLVARDEESCGGAHPDNSTLALVYDLGSGRPVDWREMLGPRLAAETTTDTVIDGTTIGMVGSDALRGLYVRARKPDKDCADVLADPSLHFVAWLDGKRRRPASGIVTSSPQAATACGSTGSIASPRRLPSNHATKCRLGSASTSAQFLSGLRART